MPAQARERRGPLGYLRKELDWVGYARRGPSDADRPAMVRRLYWWWLAALLLKMLGSTWDVSWHFRWLRDDLAPPHLLNSVGTGIVIALVIVHTYTGFGVDKWALRLMQFGCVFFLLAAPADVINHAVNGLDITSWSWPHAALYTGTGIMIIGVLRGWWLYGKTDRHYHWAFGALWLFMLEAVTFPNQHQEYGILSIAGWDNGWRTAEDQLIEFAANQSGGEFGREALVGFALPIPDSLYLAWTLAAAVLIMALARKAMGLRFAATMVAGAYVLYRVIAWGALVTTSFPPSTIPFLLIGAGLAVDLTFLLLSEQRLGRLTMILQPLVGAALAAVAVWGGALLQGVLMGTPPSPVTASSVVPAFVGVPPTTLPSVFVGAAFLAALWFAANVLAASKVWLAWLNPSRVRWLPPESRLTANPVA